MARAKTTKQATARISKKAEARIVELSLQHPDFGARRLVSLLTQEKIRVSSSQIYGILKRHDLQTREKRLARLEKQAPQKAKSAPAKPHSEITDETAEQIVTASLQNPDFGARRLVSLLKDNDIPVSASAVYAVLKRNGLQNRNSRLKRLKDQAPKPAPVRSSAPAGISPEVEEQIVEISLQNPDFGAKRLLPLMQESGIDASTSKVYSILKRRGLQTRKLRLAELDELRDTEGAPAPEEAPAEFAPEIEERIVEVSLRNPEHGARRLAGLLAGEGILISSSALYILLKRHGLQTRSLRLSRIELQDLTDASPPEAETASPYAVPMPATPEEPEPAREETVDIPEAYPAAPAPSAPAKSPRRARWFFYLADLCLLALVAYLGYHAVLNFRQARFQPQAVAAVRPEPVSLAVQPQVNIEPLKGYHTIWERNLFNIPEKEAPAEEKEIPVEKIALAKKDLGLTLMGTVVANDAAFSRAIVHVSKTRAQDAYREGEQAGEAKIKKILRNKVVITTDKGDLLLTVDQDDFGKSGGALSNQRRAPMSLTAPQPTAAEMGSGSPGTTPRRSVRRAISLNRDEVQATLADTDQLLQQLTVSPFMQGDQPAGFIISNIPRGSILTRMGLRNGYVVTGINDQGITNPDQAAEFFRTLAQGGEVTIQVRRSKGVRRRSQIINLNIE